MVTKFGGDIWKAGERFREGAVGDHPHVSNAIGDTVEQLEGQRAPQDVAKVRNSTPIALETQPPPHFSAYAPEVAAEVGRWLSLQGYWRRVSDLRHVLRGSLSLELFDGVADRIADVRMIPDGPLPEPLASLPDIASELRNHVNADEVLDLEQPEWVTAATDMLL